MLRGVWARPSLSFLIKASSLCILGFWTIYSSWAKGVPTEKLQTIKKVWKQQINRQINQKKPSSLSSGPKTTAQDPCFSPVPLHPLSLFHLLLELLSLFLHLNSLISCAAVSLPGRQALNSWLPAAGCQADLQDEHFLTGYLVLSCMHTRHRC